MPRRYGRCGAAPLHKRPALDRRSGQRSVGDQPDGYDPAPIQGLNGDGQRSHGEEGADAVDAVDAVDRNQRVTDEALVNASAN